MARLRAAELVLAAALASLCCAVYGFTWSTAVCNTATCVGKSVTSTSPIQQQQQKQQQSWTHTQRSSRIRGLRALRSMESEDDMIEEYRKQMADFMAQAHEKRLQAMQAVKEEVQRGYEEQIADLQAKLAALPANAGVSGEAAAPAQVAEPQLVGAGNGATAAGSGSALGTGNTMQHAGYAARLARPGWEARWGPEESVRAAITVSSADVLSLESRATATATATVAAGGGNVNSAYAARSQRPGWDARWGVEEATRSGGGSSGAGALPVATAGPSHAAYAARARRPGWEARWGSEETARTGREFSAAGVQIDVHPAYAARARRRGWEQRWGPEEPGRMATKVSSTSASAAVAAQPQIKAATPAEAHTAYAARAQRPGWEARWGAEELARMAATATSSTSVAPSTSAQARSTAAAPAEENPAYAARAKRPGWEARWGSEEPARMAATTTSYSPGAPAATLSAQTAAGPADSHPAYAARSGRPGWEARWGSEERERVAGADAGAAAGFATAGGLDATASAAAASPATASATSAQGDADDGPLVDDFLPNDVADLKRMVVSNRRHFQDYLIKSQQASSELRQTNVKLEAELSSSTAKLTAEQQLRESLQESFLEYMRRNGDAGAIGQTRISELEKDARMLAAETEELQRFTQEYMVKASSDKMKALELAAANERAQSAERIAMLEAQVLELQAGR